NDGTRVDSMVDEMHRATGDFNPIFEGLFLRVDPRKGRQQRGVNVDDPSAKSVKKARRENTHETGKGNPFHPRVLQRSGEGHIKVGARPEALVIKSQSGNARFFRPL